MSIDPGAVAADPKPNSFQRMAGVLVAPAETFSSIARIPDWIIPLLVILVISTASTFIAVRHIDFDSTIRAQLADRGLKGEQADRAVELGKKIGEMTPYFTIVTVPIVFLLFAGVLLLAFNLMAGAGRFVTFFSIVLYSWLPQVIKGIVMTALVARSGLMTQNEMMSVLKSNPGALVDPEKQHMLFALLSSFDVFNIWTIVLLVIGLAIAAKVSRAKSAGIVVGLYALIILGKVGLAAVQSLGARG